VSAPHDVPPVAAALPATVPMALFIGGLPTHGSSPAGRSPLDQTLRRVARLAGEEASLEEFLGPLARSGFDPARPGRVGLVAGDGLAVFDAGGAVGLAGRLRSPSKWRAAVSAATADGIEPLEVDGAREAGFGAVDEDLHLAWARRPPWLHVLAGRLEPARVSAQLAALLETREDSSLARLPVFRSSTLEVGRDMGLLLWADRAALANLRFTGPAPEAADVSAPPLTARDADGAPPRPWAGAGAGADQDADDSTWARLLSGLARPEGLALGLGAGADRLRIEALLRIRGSLLDALDRTVQGHSVCRIAPASLARQCPMWAMSVLDLGLLVRAAPSIAGQLSRLAGRLGDVLRPGRGREKGRGGGALGLAVTRLKPLPPLDLEAAEMPDLFEALDGFLVLQLLGEALPARVAGRMLDTVGDAVRGGLKRLKLADEELSTARLGGHLFHVAVRRGALVVATSPEALVQARALLEAPAPVTLPAGYLVGAGVDAPRLLAQLAPEAAAAAGTDDEAALLPLADVQRAIARFGRARLEITRVPEGLAISLDQETEETG